MAFFVVQRDADSALSIPLPDAYPTREAAIAALSAATSSGSLVLTGEVFIADLSNAVPVLVMQAASSPSTQEAQPVQEPGELDAASAEEVYSAPLLGDEQSLAAALKRAATSLEQEGIVAPASIESAPAEAQEAGEAEDSVAEEAPAAEPEGDRPWEWANVQAYEETDDVVTEPEDAEAPAIAAEVADSDETVGAELEMAVDQPEDEPDDAVVPAATESSPVEPEDAPLADATAEGAEDYESPYLEAPVLSIPEPLPAIEDSSDQDGEQLDDTGAEEPDDADEPLDSELYGLTGATPAVMIADESPIITSAPAEGEDVYVPRPVILGDYTDAVLPAGLEDTGDDGQVLQAAQEESFDENAAAEIGYEATGELDLGEYTCQDCVYSNTCPKVGQATPADCGSFQWRSE